MSSSRHSSTHPYRYTTSHRSIQPAHIHFDNPSYSHLPRHFVSDEPTGTLVDRIGWTITHPDLRDQTRYRLSSYRGAQTLVNIYDHATSLGPILARIHSLAERSSAPRVVKQELLNLINAAYDHNATIADNVMSDLGTGKVANALAGILPDPPATTKRPRELTVNGFPSGTPRDSWGGRINHKKPSTRPSLPPKDHSYDYVDDSYLGSIVSPPRKKARSDSIPSLQYLTPSPIQYPATPLPPPTTSLLDNINSLVDAVVEAAATADDEPLDYITLSGVSTIEESSSNSVSSEEEGINWTSRMRQRVLDQVEDMDRYFKSCDDAIAFTCVVKEPFRLVIREKGGVMHFMESDRSIHHTVGELTERISNAIPGASPSEVFRFRETLDLALAIKFDAPLWTYNPRKKDADLHFTARYVYAHQKDYLAWIEKTEVVKIVQFYLKKFHHTWYEMHPYTWGPEETTWGIPETVEATVEEGGANVTK